MGRELVEEEQARQHQPWPELTRVCTRSGNSRKRETQEKEVNKKRKIEEDGLIWGEQVGHGVEGGEWEKSGFIEAKSHRISWRIV